MHRNNIQIGGDGMGRLVEARAQVFSGIQEATVMKEKAAQERLVRGINSLGQLGSSVSRKKALKRALDAAISVMSADFGNIQLLDRNRNGLFIEAHRGFKKTFLDFFRFVDDRNTSCGVALSERRSVVVEDVISSPIFAQTRGLEVLLDAGVRAVKSTPLITSKGRVLGILSVHYREPQAHIDSNLTRFQKIAGTAADLIDTSLRRNGSRAASKNNGDSPTSKSP